MIAAFIIETRLKMTRKNVPRQVWEMVKLLKPFITTKAGFKRFHGERVDQMGRRYFTNPDTNCKSCSGYSINDSVSDKVQKLITNLCITKSNSRQE